MAFHSIRQLKQMSDSRKPALIEEEAMEDTYTASRPGTGGTFRITTHGHWVSEKPRRLPSMGFENNLRMDDECKLFDGNERVSEQLLKKMDDEIDSIRKWREEQKQRMEEQMAELERKAKEEEEEAIRQAKLEAEKEFDFLEDKFKHIGNLKESENYFLNDFQLTTGDQKGLRQNCESLYKITDEISKKINDSEAAVSSINLTRG